MDVEKSIEIGIPTRERRREWRLRLERKPERGNGGEGKSGGNAAKAIFRTLRKESPSATLLNPNRNQAFPSLRRAFSLYDQINLIDNLPEDQLRFQGYTDSGFTVNGVNYEGSLLCVGNLLTSWSPTKFSEITPNSLSIFQIVRPVPELLILGCGRTIIPVSHELRNFVRSIGMKLETLDSRNAASTYNILNEEGRIVAEALLPYGVTS